MSDATMSESSCGVTDPAASIRPASGVRQTWNRALRVLDYPMRLMHKGNSSPSKVGGTLTFLAGCLMYAIPSVGFCAIVISALSSAPPPHSRAVATTELYQAAMADLTKADAWTVVSETEDFLGHAGYMTVRASVGAPGRSDKWDIVLGMPSFAGPVDILIGQDDGRYLLPSTSPLVAYVCNARTCYRHK